MTDKTGTENPCGAPAPKFTLNRNGELRCVLPAGHDGFHRIHEGLEWWPAPVSESRA